MKGVPQIGSQSPHLHYLLAIFSSVPHFLNHRQTHLFPPAVLPGPADARAAVQNGAPVGWMWAAEQEVQKPPWVSQASVEWSRQEDLGIMVLQQSGVYPQKNSKFVDGKWFNKFHKSSCFGDFRGTPSDKTQLALPPGFAQVRFAGLGKTT